MRRYTQLTQEQRYQIKALLKTGHGLYGDCPRDRRPQIHHQSKSETESGVATLLRNAV